MSRSNKTPEELYRKELQSIDKQIRKIKAEITIAEREKARYSMEALAIEVEQNPESKEAKEKAKKDRRRREELYDDRDTEEAKLKTLRAALYELKPQSAAVQKNLDEIQQGKDEDPNGSDRSLSGALPDGKDTMSGDSEGLLTGFNRHEYGFTGAGGSGGLLWRGLGDVYHLVGGIEFTAGVPVSKIIRRVLRYR